MASPRPRTVLSRSLFAAAGAAFMLAANASRAQPVEAPPPPRVPQGAIHQVPSYCQRSTLTGFQFLQLIHTIIAHGDLTDIKFLEKTLGTKFSTSHGWSEKGTPDPQILFLDSERTLGNPISVHIIIIYAKSDQLRLR